MKTKSDKNLIQTFFFTKVNPGERCLVRRQFCQNEKFLKDSILDTGLNFLFSTFEIFSFMIIELSYNKQKIAINYIQAILILTKDGGKNVPFGQDFQTQYLLNGKS